MRFFSNLAVSSILNIYSFFDTSFVTNQLPRCRCLSTQPCWPSNEAFSALASQLSQPLVYPVPAASPCYPPQSPPSDQCQTVRDFWTNGNWHADQPGSVQEPNWGDHVFQNGSISTCYLDTTLGAPCEQGNIPPIGVDARKPEDLQAAVKFAAKYNLKVVIKNTGYDRPIYASGLKTHVAYP